MESTPIDPLDEDTKADSLSADEKKRLEEQRIVDVFNWVWQPEAERLQVEWDAMDFVVRLLKRPGGIVFMGGAYLVSLCEEDFRVDIDRMCKYRLGLARPRARLRVVPPRSWHIVSDVLPANILLGSSTCMSPYYFFGSSPRLTQRVPHAPYHSPHSLPTHILTRPQADPDKDNGHPTIRSQILTPGHPVTLELQKRAGVPDSRMKRPVFSIIEEHLLVHEDELRRLVGMSFLS